MRKRIFTVLTVLGLTLGLTFATPASPASASWSECPTSHLCLWDNDGGGSPKIIDLAGWIWGFEQHFVGDPNTYGCYNFPGAVNDRANSIWNRYPANHKVIVFEGYNCVSSNPDCGSNFVTLFSGQSTTFTHWFWCGLKDVASSVRIQW